MRPKWLITAILCMIFGIWGCEATSEPVSQHVSAEADQTESPYKRTSLPAVWDPCASSVGWISLGYEDFINTVNQSLNGLTATFAHYDRKDDSLYIVGNSLLSLFGVNRLNATGVWEEIYGNNLSQFCQPLEENCFPAGMEAYDDDNQLLFFSIMEDVISIESQGSDNSQQVPSNFKPLTSVAVDPADARLYISFPDGIASRRYGANDWRIEVWSVDLPGQLLERIWIFQTVGGSAHVCASVASRLACRDPSNEWVVLPGLEAGKAPNTIDDIAYEATTDRLFLLSKNRIWLSEALNGWKIWYENALFQIDEIEPALNGGLYIRSGRQFWLINEFGEASRRILLPPEVFDVYSGYDIRQFTVVPGEPVGLVFEDEDGCPSADQLCLATEVYSVCLQ